VCKRQHELNRVVERNDTDAVVGAGEAQQLGGGCSDRSKWGAAHRAGSIEHDHYIERCAPYWGSGWCGELDEDIDDLANADGDDGAIKLD